MDNSENSKKIINTFAISLVLIFYFCYLFKYCSSAHNVEDLSQDYLAAYNLLHQKSIHPLEELFSYTL